MGYFEDLKSWQVKWLPSHILFKAVIFVPKKFIGKVKFNNDPKLKHLKFPFNNLCLKFKLR